MDSVQAMAEGESGAVGLGSSAVPDVYEFGKSILDYSSGIESREENLRLNSESLEKRERDLEKREREVEELKWLQEGRSEELSFREAKLDEQLRSVHEHIEASQRKEEEKLIKIEKKERELGELKWLQERRSEELSLKKEKLDELLRSINEQMERLRAVEGRVEDLRREQVAELDMIEEKKREVKEREERIAKIEEEDAVVLLGWQELEEKHKEIEQWLERLDARDKDLDQRENAVRQFELQQHSTNASSAGHIQNLINHKEYLLASTYAFEYQLQHRFKQAAILNYYLSYSKRCAYQQARNERNTFEAKDKAIVREIADLHAAVAHIIKYGLQDEYSPNVLSARIQQLESNRDNLRQGCPSTSSPADMWRKGNRKRSRYPNKWKDRRNLREASSNPQMPSWSPSPARRAEHQLGSTEMHPGAPPPGFPNPWPGVHLVPMPHPGPDGPYKRHCPNVWFNGGHLGQFGDQH